MIEGPDYIRSTIPEPGEQYLNRFLMSDLSHTATTVQQFSETGIFAPVVSIDHFLSVSLEHA